MFLEMMMMMIWRNFYELQDVQAGTVLFDRIFQSLRSSLDGLMRPVRDLKKNKIDGFPVGIQSQSSCQSDIRVE
jgi:hypothetical protein